MSIEFLSLGKRIKHLISQKATNAAQLTRVTNFTLGHGAQLTQTAARQTRGIRTRPRSRPGTSLLDFQKLGRANAPTTYVLWLLFTVLKCSALALRTLNISPSSSNPHTRISSAIVSTSILFLQRRTSKSDLSQKQSMLLAKASREAECEKTMLLTEQQRCVG